MKRKLLFIALACLLMSIGDVYSSENYSSEQESEMAPKRRKAKKRTSYKKKGRRGGSDDKKMNVALSGGLAIPIGSFANGGPTVDASASISQQQTSSSSQSAGADLGYFGDLSFTYKFTENFGATSLIRGQFHPGSSTLANTSMGPMTSSASVEVGTFKIFSFMVGPYGAFKIGDLPLSVDARILFGLSMISTPEITGKLSSGIDIPGMNLSMDMSQPSYSMTGFGYLFGLGACYDLSDMFFLRANLDYFGAQATYKLKMTTAVSGLEGIPGFESLGNMEVDAKQAVSTFAISLGFGIRF